MKRFKHIAVKGVGLVSVAAAGAASAQGGDPYAAITSAANWSSVASGIGAIGAAAAAVAVVIYGVGILVRKVRSGG